MKKKMVLILLLIFGLPVAAGMIRAHTVYDNKSLATENILPQAEVILEAVAEEEVVRCFSYEPLD